MLTKDAIGLEDACLRSRIASVVFDVHIPGVSKEEASAELGLKMKARTDAPAKMTPRRYAALIRIRAYCYDSTDSMEH